MDTYVYFKYERRKAPILGHHILQWYMFASEVVFAELTTHERRIVNWNDAVMEIASLIRLVLVFT